jgi:WD40 repeat protein
MLHFSPRWFRSSVVLFVLVSLIFTAFAQEAPKVVFIPRFDSGNNGGLQDVHKLLWSADNKTLVMQGGADLRVWDTETGKLRWSLKNINAGSGVALSPDGQWLVSDRVSPRTEGRWLGIYRLRDGLKVLTKKFPVEFITGLDWSSDGKWIAVNGGSDVHFLHAGNLEFDSMLEPVCRWVLGLAWRPGTSDLALGCQDGSVELYEVGGEAIQFPSERKIVAKKRSWIFTPKNRRNGYGGLAWNADGSRLAFVWNFMVTILNPNSGNPEIEFPVDTDTPRLGYTTDALAWSPDDSLLAVTGGNQVIFLHDSSNGKRLAEFGARAVNQSVVFSPDARFVVTGADGGNWKFLSLWGAQDRQAVFQSAKWR